MRDVKTKLQKIIKVGNSYAVTLDSEFVKEQGFDKNPSIMVRYANKAGVITAGNKDKISINGWLTEDERKGYIASKVTEEFRDWVDKTLVDDAEAMEKLANQ